MGHLVNPIAFRVGWSRQWIDEFFVESSFYPEILHRLLRFRYFLNCFFNAKVAPSRFKKYTVSHFTFDFGLQGFGLKIFFYNSRMDPCWYKFWDKVSPRPYGLRFFPKARHDPPLFAPWTRKAFFLLFILYHYAVNGVFDEPYRYRMSFFKAFHETLQPDQFADAYRYYLNRKYRRQVQEFSLSERECFAFLHLMRHRTLQETGRINYNFPGYGVRSVNYEAVCQTFFRALYIHQITKPYLRMFFEWLRFLGASFFLKLPFTIRFYQVNNDQLSARFIAKFIALRCRQGFSVKTILRPIRKDLRLSKRMASRLHFKTTELERTAFQRSGRGTLSSFAPLLRASRTFNNRLEFTRHHLPSFDHFFWAYSQRHNYKPRKKPIRKLGLRRRKHLIKFKSSKVKFRKVKSSKIRFRKVKSKFYLRCRLFFERRLYFTFFQQLTAEVKKMFFLKGYFYGFFLEMAFNRVLSYHSSHGFHRDLLAFTRITPAALYHLTGGVLISFLNFSVQASAPARSFDSVFGIKRRDFRFMKPLALGLQGFRIRLHGRFTRKQIAASYHFQEGSMPLSSMRAFIDYAFTTIPLRNSAIGVKVWLYKSGPRGAHEHCFSF